jgi:hypothetical protein
MEYGIEDLCRIIGEKEILILMLNREITRLNEQIKEELTEGTK